MNFVPAILGFLMFAVPCFCGAMAVVIVCGGNDGLGSHPKGPNPFARKSRNSFVQSEFVPSLK